MRQSRHRALRVLGLFLFLVLSFYVKALPLMGALAAVVIVPWLVVLAARKILPSAAIHDGITAILSALGAGVVLFWVSQGALSSRLQIEVAGDAYKVNENRALVVATIRVSNVGSNDVSVESATLVIVPKRNNAVVGDAQTVLTSELQFDPDRPDRFSLISDETEYCFPWNTLKTSQVSRVLPDADYYDIQFEMYTHHRITGALATWRGSAVVPLMDTVGKSPDRGSRESTGATSGVPEAILKGLKGG